MPWNKGSIRLKMAQDHNYGVQETFTIKFQRHSAEVLCYQPYGKGIGRRRNNLIDEELVTRFWLHFIIEVFEESLRLCKNAMEFNAAVNGFIDFMWSQNGIVRVYHDFK